MNPACQRKPPPFLSLGPSCAVPHPPSSGRSLVRSVSDRKAFGAGDQPDSAALPTWGYDFDPEVASRAMADKARLGSQSSAASAPEHSSSAAAQGFHLATMAEDFSGPSAPLRAHSAQLPPACWADLGRLIERFQQFSRNLAQSDGLPREGSSGALAAFARLGGEALSARQQDLDREQLGRLAVETIVGQLAVMGHRLGGAVMPAAIYFRFRKAWLQGLLAIETLKLAPEVSKRINLMPLVHSLGGQEAPMELLFSLMDLSAAQPSLGDGLRRDVVSSLLSARYAGGASASADQAVLDWLLYDLASRACPSLLFTALPHERSFQVLQGSLDAFLRVGASPLGRLGRVVSHLKGKNPDQFQGAIARCLAAAIDSCGHALPATTPAAARMHAVASALLQAWAEHPEPAPSLMMAQLITCLGNREAISWLGGTGGADVHWDQVHAASLIMNCIDDLETSEHRQVARRALDHLLRSAGGMQASAPSMAEGVRAWSRVDGTPSAKRKGLVE